MPATIVQSKIIAQNSAIGSYTFSLDAPATEGNEIIITIASDAYFNAGPSGFNEPEGARQEQYLGHYLWHKTAAGGETQFTATPQVNCTAVWAIYEVSGLSGMGSLIASDGQSVVGGGIASYTTPSLTMSAGERFVLAAIGGSLSAALTEMNSWTQGFTEVSDQRTVLSSGTRDGLGVATRQGIFTNGQVVDTSATWSGGVRPESRTSIIVAFNIGAPDTTPPSTPQGVVVTGRTDTSLTVSWDASTDDVAVAGYEVQIDGTPHGTSTGTGYSAYNLTENTTYSIRVRAYDTAGLYSGLSTAVTMTTLSGSGAFVWDGSQKQPINTTIVDPATHYGLLNRVAWEGGPSYYGTAVPALAGTEWVSSNFFPIGYWGAYVDQQSTVQKYKTLGINTLWTTYANTPDSASWIRAEGLWNMGGKLTGSGSEHGGYVVEDEVDMWGGGGWGGWTGATGFVPNVCESGGADCGYTIMQQTEAAFDDDGKMRWTNYGRGVMTYLGDDVASDFVNGTTSGGSWPLQLVTADFYFYTGGGSMIADNDLFLHQPATRRAGNYGEVIMNRLRYLDGLKGDRKPLGVVVELGGQTASGEEMTPDKVEGAVWSTLIHEARCLSYFSHAFCDTAGNPWSSNVLNDPSAPYVAIQNRVQQINQQVTELAPVLNTQSYEWVGNTEVASMMKIYGGYAYLFMMAKVAETHSSAPRTFRLPFGLSGKTAEVLYEDRTVPVRRGAIVDSFANEFTHHIYKIAL